MSDPRSPQADPVAGMLAAENAPSGGGGPAQPAAQAGGSTTHQAANMPGQHSQADLLAAAQSLADARAGNLWINLDEGQALLNTLTDAVNRLSGLLRHVNRIQWGSQLGQTPHAAAFVAFDQQVSSTGPHAFTPNHALTIQAYELHAQAVQVAMDNYRRMEQGNADRLNGTGA